MSLQIDIKSGNDLVTSLTGRGKIYLNTKEKYVDDYITIDAVHDTEDATALAVDIKQGVTAYTAYGKVNGAMPTYNWTSYDSIPIICDRFNVDSGAQSFEVRYV